jgi:hypothetical protein
MTDQNPVLERVKQAISSAVAEAMAELRRLDQEYAHMPSHEEMQALVTKRDALVREVATEERRLKLIQAEAARIRAVLGA